MKLARALKLSLATATAPVALACPTLAHAQEVLTPPPGTVDENKTSVENGSVEGQDTSSTIIVTAQGRRQVLADVPVAVNVVSAETLQNTGANDIRQLNQVAPSLLVSSTGSEANGSARIRGVGTVGDNPGLESSVAVFIDGVYRARSGIGLNELGEIERVEVLRGPQGTLFGRNASAGLINIISASPKFSFGGVGEISYGNYDYVRAAGSVTGPLSKTVAARLDGVYVRRNGFYYDATNDRRINDRDRYFLRGQLLFEPTSDISFRLIGDYTHRNEQCCAASYVRQQENPLVGQLLNPAANPIVNVLQLLGTPSAAFTRNPYDRVVYSTPGRSFAGRTEDYGISGQLDWNLGFAKLTSITAYRDYFANQASDTDYSTVDILYRAPGNDAYGRSFRTFSQELRLQGQAFSNRLDFLVGAYYANEKLRLSDNLRFGTQYGRFASCRLVTAFGLTPFLSATTPTCLNATGQAVVGNPAGPFGPGGALILQGFRNLDTLNDRGSTPDRYRQDSDNFAVFTHNILHLTDRVDVTLGLRYTTEVKRFGATFGNDNMVCPAQQALLSRLLSTPLAAAAGGLISLACQGNATSELNGVSISDRRRESELTGTGVISFKPTRDTLLYASYSRGYKAGGFNLDRSALKSPIPSFAAVGGPQALVRNLQFDPELVDAFEIGAKYAGRNFSISLAAFREQFSNFQLNTFNGSVYLVQNVNGCTQNLGGADRDTSPATGSCPTGNISYGVLAQGVEAEASIRPAPTLNVNLGFTYSDTRYRSNLVGSDRGTPLDPALRLLPGAQLSNAPEFVTTGSLTWTPPIGSSGLSALFYVDGRLTSDYNTGSDLLPQKIQDGYFLMNARVGLRGPDEHWSIELWAQNLLDTDYSQVAFNSPFQAGPSSLAAFPAAQYPAGTQIFGAFLAEPRTYGLTLRGRF